MLRMTLPPFVALMKTLRQKTLRRQSQKKVRKPVRRVHLTVQRRQPAGRLKPAKKRLMPLRPRPVQSQQQGMQRTARPVPVSLKKPPELMQKKPDSMLKRPGWRRRAPERSLSGQRLQLSVLKRPDVWLKMRGDLRDPVGHRVKQGRWGRRDRRAIPALRGCRG
ncbi:hypothetical protein BvCmsNSP027_02236 [Escherichia coli]|nr:hypothetical protein BvCmsHHP016_02320 [Escherichia coli]GDR06439.1 hypothetical protein BvCmsNSP027_02236 [Escherichia coli]